MPSSWPICWSRCSVRRKGTVVVLFRRQKAPPFLEVLLLCSQTWTTSSARRQPACAAPSGSTPQRRRARAAGPPPQPCHRGTAAAITACHHLSPPFTVALPLRPRTTPRLRSHRPRRHNMSAQPCAQHGGDAVGCATAHMKGQQSRKGEAVKEHGGDGVGGCATPLQDDVPIPRGAGPLDVRLAVRLTLGLLRRGIRVHRPFPLAALLPYHRLSPAALLPFHRLSRAAAAAPPGLPRVGSERL